MRKRKLIPLLLAVAIFAALGVMFYLRAKAPPEAARLLPESDAIVYVHLKDIRSATHFDLSPVPRSPAFQQFIDATGIVPERDLDAVAFALHRVVTPAGPGHPLPGAELFTSEVFVGRFDGQRLAQYLDRIATGRETYAGRTVYSVPLQTGEPGGQTLRIAQLGYDTLAASNMPTSEQIHSMLDRSRTSALSTSGSSLLAARFSAVPLLSEAWGIGHIGLPFAAPDSGAPGQVAAFGLQLPVPADSDLIASLRYNGATHMLSGGSVHLRIEEIAPNAAAAQHTVDSLNELLSLLHAIEAARPSASPADAALSSVLASAKLTQHNEHALLDTSATIDDLKAIFNAHDPAAASK
jgi:hypothetical protein